MDYGNVGCDIRNDTEIYDSDTISLQLLVYSKHGTINKGIK